MEKKFLKLFRPGIVAVFGLLVLCVCCTWFLSRGVFFAQLGALVLMSAWYVQQDSKRQKSIVQYVQDLTYHVDSAAKGTILSFPMPIAVVRATGTISWYNDKFIQLLDSDEVLFEHPVSDALPGFDAKRMLELGQSQQTCDLSLHGRSFRVYVTVMKNGKQSDLLTLYLIERTGEVALQQELERTRPVVGMIVLDNYDELFQNAKEIEKVNALAAVDERLTAWADQSQAMLQKFERDSYLFFMEAQQFYELEQTRFSILESVRELTVGPQKMPLTLSIGVGIGRNSLLQKYEFASSSIELALGRGGDQAVIKSPEGLSYYGGRSQEVEKRTKVKTRVMATALKELMLDCETVLVMGHLYADLDALGAGVGVSRMARNYGKPVRIVLGPRSATVQKAVALLEEEGENRSLFVQPGAAKELCVPRTLLIVVDTHNPDYVESPELIDLCDRVVVIDHHRRSERFIDKSILTFQEPYASSASEMVAEMMSYLDVEHQLTAREANALLAGIVLDTKSFTIKTGVRTFEAASYLRRTGADTVVAKQLLQSDLAGFQQRTALMAKAVDHDGVVVMSDENADSKLDKEVFAQAVDEMLTVQGVRAAFGVARFGDQVHISARSYGAVNVQRVLEKLGGGGHHTTAGAQLDGLTVEQAVKKLEKALAELRLEQTE